MEGIVDRLQELMKELNLNAANLADEIGVQRSGISHFLSGRNKPSIEFIQKLSDRFNDVDVHWLITGNRLSSNGVNDVESFDKAKDAQVTSNLKSSKVEKIVMFYDDGTFTEHHLKEA